MSYPWYSTPLFMDGFVSFSVERNCETKEKRYVAKAPTISVYRKHVLCRSTTLDDCIMTAYDNVDKIHPDYREADCLGIERYAFVAFLGGLRYIPEEAPDVAEAWRSACEARRPRTI